MHESLNLTTKRPLACCGGADGVAFGGRRYICTATGRSLPSQPCPSLVGGTGQVQVLQDGRSRKDLAQDLLAHVLRRSEEAPLLVKAVEVQNKTQRSAKEVPKKCQRSAIRIRSKQLPPVSWRAPLAAAFPVGPLPKNVVLRTSLNQH